jgi:hypothetical protein
VLLIHVHFKPTKRRMTEISRKRIIAKEFMSWIVHVNCIIIRYLLMYMVRHYSHISWIASGCNSNSKIKKEPTYAGVFFKWWTLECYVDIEVNADNARVKVEVHDPSVTSWSTSTYCNPSTGPGPEEYHVLIKKGTRPTSDWDMFKSMQSIVLK